MNEIYWDDYPSSVVSSAFQNDTLILLFEGKSSEYGSNFSGKISLKLHLEEQVSVGTIYYQYENGTHEEIAYELTGAFEDDSWEFFTGVWVEKGEIYTFDALLETAVKDELKIDAGESTEDINEADQCDQHQIEIKTKKISERHGVMRQRAARSNARVRKIQRSIELYYGLPQGSVRLVNPDRTLIHPSAKIGTLRDRWITEEV